VNAPSIAQSLGKGATRGVLAVVSETVGHQAPGITSHCLITKSRAISQLLLRGCLYSSYWRECAWPLQGHHPEQLDELIFVYPDSVNLPERQLSYYVEDLQFIVLENAHAVGCSGNDPAAVVMVASWAISRPHVSLSLTFRLTARG
jgi:hypothetical protein